MACKDCYTGCDEVTPDKCVQYTGEDIPLLGICSGDFLSDVHKIILDKFLEVIDGSGIDLSSITLSCQYTKDLVGNSDKTVAVLIQKLFDSQCTLKQLIDQALAPDPSFSFNTSCLTLPANPSKDDILQAAITKLCSVDTRLTVIENDYVKSSELETLVNQIITPTTTPTTVQFFTRMVPFVAVPYFGPLSNFDNNGKGLSSVGYDKIYICNGQNLTPDLRGRTIVGAVRNVPGGALDAAVDPTSPINPNSNYSVGDKFGETHHTLSISEVPAHSHPVNDPGHVHPPMRLYARNINYGNENSTKVLQANSGNNSLLVTPQGDNTSTRVTTGISVGSVGSGAPFNVRQPSIAALWIMYIP